MKPLNEICKICCWNQRSMKQNATSLVQNIKILLFRSMCFNLSILANGAQYFWHFQFSNPSFIFIDSIIAVEDLNCMICVASNWDLMPGFLCCMDENQNKRNNKLSKKRWVDLLRPNSDWPLNVARYKSYQRSFASGKFVMSCKHKLRPRIIDLGTSFMQPRLLLSTNPFGFRLSS